MGTMQTKDLSQFDLVAKLKTLSFEDGDALIAEWASHQPVSMREIAQDRLRTTLVRIHADSILRP